MLLSAAAGISGLTYILWKLRVFPFHHSFYSEDEFFQKAVRVKNKYLSFIIQLNLNLTTGTLNDEGANETIVGKIYLFGDEGKALGSEFQSQNLWDKPLWIPFVMDSFDDNRGCEGLTYIKTKQLMTYTTFCIDYEDYFNQNNTKEKILGITKEKFNQYLGSGIKTVFCVPIFLYHRKRAGMGKNELIPEKCAGILSYISDKKFNDSCLSGNHHPARIHARFLSYMVSKYNWYATMEERDLADIQQAEIRHRKVGSGMSRENYVETVPGIYFMPEIKSVTGLSEFINAHISEKTLWEEIEEFVAIESYL